MVEDQKWDLVLVGAGAGGLVLALTLAEKGFRIAVIDRQVDPAPLPRGEIVQPNGLRILDQLGVLSKLLESDIYRNERVDFYQASGPHLCTVDYRTLPILYNYSLILLPDVIQKVLLERVRASSNITLFGGVLFKELLHEREGVAGVVAEHQGVLRRFLAPMVVGGDGVRSAVRTALRIPHKLHTYVDGYLTMVVDRPSGFRGESRYYLGQRKIFGAFPVSEEKLYLFFMIPSNRLDGFRQRGIGVFKEEILSFHPSLRALLEGPIKKVTSWEEIAYMPCFRVQCKRWVANGAALIGDAAHAMNPHVAQGRNAAMEDGVILAEVLEDCFRAGDFSKAALALYEKRRRSTVEGLQRIGDEMTWLWNSGFPPSVWARDRIFQSVHQKRDLHDKMLSNIAGLHQRPFDLFDRWRALHLWGPLSPSIDRRY
ncbi:MAG: FAD-dependent monooxygenase [Nitrospirae bacterium]|nr:FAD-dependent monooxygenase [Nitrospirota bacterium]MBI3805567.1 FAD-dependent monooxygenase [Candidatus Manganitrophaceae bacterium]